MERTRGYRKKERTRRQLVAAGLAVWAEKGQGFTVSDVVAVAEVSNGTFYNYFEDREAFLEALAQHSILSLAAAVASEPIEDPARRFAVATTRVLRLAGEDPTWARVALRLVSRPGPGLDFSRYMREDLADGFEKGRFDSGPDEATLDLVTGGILMTIRRIAEGGDPREVAERGVARGLRLLGLDAEEAATLASEAAAEPAPESNARRGS